MIKGIAHPCDVPSLVGDRKNRMPVLPRESNHLQTDKKLAIDELIASGTHQTRCHEEDDVRDRVYGPIQTPEEEERRGDGDHNSQPICVALPTPSRNIPQDQAERATERRADHSSHQREYRIAAEAGKGQLAHEPTTP